MLQGFRLMFQFVSLCVLLVSAVLNSVEALGYPSQGQEQDLGQDLAPGQGQGQGGGISGGARQGSLGQQGSFGRGAGGFRSGAAEGRSYGGSQYGGQPGGEDASQYNFRIYTEPEYYGYESKFPGGKAMFKSYRSAARSSESGLGEFTSTKFRIITLYKPNENVKYEVPMLLECDAVYSGRMSLTFRRNVLALTSGSKSKPS
jgi:hypothetical protein